eukprot:gene8460-biopygen3133
MEQRVTTRNSTEQHGTVRNSTEQHGTGGAMWRRMDLGTCYVHQSVSKTGRRRKICEKLTGPQKMFFSSGAVTAIFSERGQGSGVTGAFRSFPESPEHHGAPRSTTEHNGAPSALRSTTEHHRGGRNKS